MIAVPAGHLDSPDAVSRLLQTEAFLRGRVTIPAEMVNPEQAADPLPAGLVPRTDGTYLSKYGAGQSILWLLPVLAAHTASAWLGLPPHRACGVTVSFVNTAVTLATLLSLSALLRAAGLGSGSARLTMALYLFGTMALPYAGTCWSEPLVGLLLLWAVGLRVVGSSIRLAFLSGLLVAGAAIVKPELVVLAVPVAVAWLGPPGRRTRPALAYGLGAALGPCWIAVSNGLLRGSPRSFSYAQEAHRFSGPWDGLAGLLWSGDKGVFLHNPALVLAGIAWLSHLLPAPLRPTRWSVGLTALVTLVLYASWWGWGGGISHGPRFLVILLPILLLPVGPVLGALRAPAARAATAALVTAVLAVSLPIQLAGLLVSDDQAEAIQQYPYELAPWRVRLRLLELKLLRGPRAPEIYRRSDLVELRTEEADVVFDHRRNPTFQYLHQWMSLALVPRLRRSG